MIMGDIIDEIFGTAKKQRLKKDPDWWDQTFGSIYEDDE